MFRHPCPALYNQAMHGIRTIIALPLLLLVTRPAVAQQVRLGVQFFEKKTRPGLLRSCYKCHSAKSKELGGKLRLNHTRLTYRYGGRDFRLTDVHGRVVKEILA